MTGIEKGLTKRRGRLKGVDIRPGSVRRARSESGLSLAGVAGQDLTRAAIHLIETGRSRPSMPTLELIASRTGKPLSYFLAPSQEPATAVIAARIDEVELLLQTNRFQLAIALGQRVIGEAGIPAALAHLHLWIGIAMLRSDRRGPGREHLARARHLFSDLDNRLMGLEAADWEGAALIADGDAAAMPLLEEALAACRQLVPVPAGLESRLLGRLAQHHALQQDWDRAVALYQAALEPVSEGQELTRQARHQESMAAAYAAAGEVARATAYTNRALAIHQVLSERTAAAALRSRLGYALLKQGALEEAERHLTDALGRLRELGGEGGTGDAILGLGELRLAQGRVADAREMVGQATELARRFQQPLNAALAEMLSGRLAADQGAATEADERFERAITMLHGLGARDRLIECRTAFAEVLERRGDTKGALSQAKLALAASRPGSGAAAATAADQPDAKAGPPGD